MLKLCNLLAVWVRCDRGPVALLDLGNTPRTPTSISAPAIPVPLYVDNRPLLAASKPELREYKCVCPKRRRNWLDQ